MNLHFACARLLLLPPRRFKFPSTPLPHLRSPPNTGPALGFLLRSPLCTRATGIAMESPAPPFAVKDEIELTDKERKIFDCLLSVLRRFRLDTELRVAGGWVRDKLLGQDCSDIDIAIDNMLGREFCEKVNEYLESEGEKQQGIGVIQCNPDQSKHLETATMRLYDIEIDFVNLRSETYVENSRIPTMEFGTASEDAYRRDLTINSLFYNINKNSVEDLTGRGVQDLKAGYIVTPLPPKSTFLDDPLRVLRSIRFGARFNFVLDEELQKAASDEEVREAIANKISRERIGHEVDRMITGNQPVKAITYICDVQLFYAVFTLPENPQPSLTEGCDRVCLSYMDAAWNVLQLVGCSRFSDEQRRLYLYAALFLPLKDMVYKDRKSKLIPVVNYIFMNSLKSKSKDAEKVVNLHAQSVRFSTFVSFLERNESLQLFEAELEDECLNIPPSFVGRVFAGLLLHEIKDYWRVALLLSTLLSPKDDPASDFRSSNFELDRRREIFLRVENVITKLGLDNIWDVKPLLDGKAIMGILQLKSGGPKIREWQIRMRKWQLAHPEGTSEECIKWMQQSQVKRLKLDTPV